MYDAPAMLCAGRCNAQWRAAERRYENTGTDHTLEPREGSPVWCPPCTTSIRAALAELPALADMLLQEIESGVSAAMTEYVSGSRNRPVHDHEAASFLLDEVCEWIREWEDTVRRELELVERKPALTQYATIHGAVAFLLPHLGWHIGGRTAPEYDRLHSPDWTGADIARDFGSTLLSYHRRAQGQTGSGDVEPVRCEGVRCRECDSFTLEYEVDANGMMTGAVRCRRCRPLLVYTAEEYAQWVAMLAHAARKQINEAAA